MNGHHLILGQLTDIITGETIDDTLDERYRQAIGQLLIHEKSYSRGDIVPRHPLDFTVDGRCAQLLITYLVTINATAAMIIQFGPGSLVTRHRPALAIGRLTAPHQIPVVVVTNGEQADVLCGASGRIESTGLHTIPERSSLLQRVQRTRREKIAPDRLEMEARILMAFEVDGSCPCDDSVCKVQQE